MIATAIEDDVLLSEICEKISENELNAKEAAKALRREFKWVMTLPPKFPRSNHRFYCRYAEQNAQIVAIKVRLRLRFICTFPNFIKRVMGHITS